MADDVGTWRRLRAEIAASEKKCDALRLEIAVRESQLRTVPQVNPSRRAKLISKPDTLATDLTEVVHRQSDIDNRIIHARGVLVREAIAVFGVQEDEIARLKLPPPGHFRRECPGSELLAC